MTYINDSNFVHRVFYTIEKEVHNDAIKSKLHEYFTKNVHKIDYELFLVFARAIGQIRRLYDNSNVKFSNTFVLVLLTYLHEAKNVFPSDVDVVEVFVNKFMKKIPDSERVTFVFSGFDKFQCLYYLVLKLQMYIGASNNIDDKVVRERIVEMRRERQDNNNNSTGRRYRSRSRENVRSRPQQNKTNNSMRIWGSHLTEEQRAELEKQHTEVEQTKQRNESNYIPIQTGFVPQQPPPPPSQSQNFHTNADDLISRLVRDNHSLYDAIRQRDNTIINLQNEIDRLRRGRNI